MFIRFDEDNYTFMLSENKLSNDFLKVYQQYEISLDDMLKFIRFSSHWKSVGDTLVTSCNSLDSELYKYYSEVVSKTDDIELKRHVGDLPKNISDLNSRVVYNVDGSSKLVRKNDKGQIFIARRTGKESVSYADSVIIDNIVRERFFASAKNSSYYKTYHKYVISKEDKQTYLYWSNFMDNLFKSYKDATSNLY